MLLSKPRLVLMDESTSALDVGNEASLYKALADAGITYVSVGHRPSLVRHHLYAHAALVNLPLQLLHRAAAAAADTAILSCQLFDKTFDMQTISPNHGMFS